jgi:hypothetical protein
MLMAKLEKEKVHRFTATIDKPYDGINGAFVNIPFDVGKVFGTKGMVKVKAKFDGYPYRGILHNMGTGCHVIILRKDVRAAIGKEFGDVVDVEIIKDTEERIVDIPPDLEARLSKNKKAKTFFDSLSYTNKKEYAVWITSAKKVETREKRLAEIMPKLLMGRKNPTDKG